MEWCANVKNNNQGIQESLEFINIILNIISFSSFIIFIFKETLSSKVHCIHS